MMFEALYRYLILHKKLAVPDIGTFLLERKPAEPDFVNKQINPPFFTVSLQPPGQSPSFSLFKWLAGTLHISDHDAVIRFNDFLFELKKQLANGDTVDWHGVGAIKTGLAGEIKFEPATIPVMEKPVAAEKVIREKAEHMVRVGEDQKTSAEMTEMLSQPKVKRSRWWIAALVTGLLSLLFIGWYFYENGMDITSAGNTMKLVPVEEAKDLYQALP